MKKKPAAFATADGSDQPPRPPPKQKHNLSLTSANCIIMYFVY